MNIQPSSLPDLRSAVASIAERIDATMRADLDRALVGQDPFLKEVLHYTLFNGGKRIRPLLIVLCSRCCGRDDDDLYLVGAAFEYLHAATLAHDDVLDRSEQRRGKPTVMARYGLQKTILGGDWLHVRSLYLMGQLTGTPGLDIFCHATSSMVNGEFEQLRQCADITTTQEQYFSIIRQKTGELITASCAIGALYAGADPLRQQALTRYGEALGAAFQITDDLLDFLGDSDATGKETGNDFVEGKITLPLLHALERASSDDRDNLAALMTGDRTRPENYARLVELITRYNGFDTARDTARDLIDRAVAALAPFAGTGPASEYASLLASLAGYVLTRNK
ncbi:MAG: polyprenyl synthetase family protein [Desulfobulbus sp.]|jgi:octaprenyl-diphosphate synthase